MIASPIPADFEGLQREVLELRALLGELSLRVEYLEGQLPVAATPTPAPSGASSGASVPTGASSLGADRISAAQKVGDWLRRCLNGEHRSLSGRELIQQPSRFYLVAKEYSGEVHNPPLVFTNWRDTKARVYHQGNPGDSVFIGLPTKEESRVALLRAGLQVPSALQRA